LGWEIPLTVLLGVTIDVSPLLRFSWYQPVFYANDNATFPSDTKESFGYFVGLSTHCGHAMTFKVLTSDTNKIIQRSQVRPADDPARPNLRLTDIFDGEAPTKVSVRSKFDSENPSDYGPIDPSTGEVEDNATPSMVPVDIAQLVDTSELIGRTFLIPGRDEGTTHRARIVEMITDEQYDETKKPDDILFKLSVNNEEYELTMAYGEVLNHINRDSE